VAGDFPFAGTSSVANSDTAEWLAEGDPDADGWGDHFAQLAHVFGNRQFTLKQVVMAGEAGQVEMPYVKHDPDRSLAHTIGNAYRSVRDRSYEVRSESQKSQARQ